MLRTIRAVMVVTLLNVAVMAAPAISLDIHYPVSSAPMSYFKARVTIEQSPDNRMACLYVVPTSAQGDQITRCWSLNGEQEPRTFWQEIKNLPTGRYLVTATVIRSDEKRTTSTAVRILVSGPGLEPDPDIP